MEIRYYFGIDISKETLDITILNETGNILLYKRIRNSTKDILAFFTSLKKEMGFELKLALICMEYTGIYNLPMVNYLSDNKASIWMESGTQIKRSMGVIRGKDDKVDSARIATYAYDNRHKMKLWSAPRDVISKISDLIGYRALLIKQKKALEVSYKEKSLFKPKAWMKTIISSSSKLVKDYNIQIKQIESEILCLIKNDQKLHHLYSLITSVKGVGLVTAAHILVATNEFINISDPKKFGCYCGVVPFKHTSGTSIRGKERVSHMANKPLKTLLHLCAISAIKIKGELRDYYLRKVATGKNKMLVVNAVRNKIVLRIFACVNNNRRYENNYVNLLA